MSDNSDTVLYPMFPSLGSGQQPPTWAATVSPQGFGTLSVFMALLIEMRVLNEQLNAQCGSSAPDLEQMRADALWSVTPGQGSV